MSEAASAGLIGVESRLKQLANPGETITAYAPCSETDEGVYFLVARHYPHPDLDDGSILNLRYAYLTRGGGSDGWVGGNDSTGAAGINMRIEGDPAEFLQGLAQLFAGSIPRLDGDRQPATDDLRPAGE